MTITTSTVSTSVTIPYKRYVYYYTSSGAGPFTWDLTNTVLPLGNGTDVYVRRRDTDWRVKVEKGLDASLPYSFTRNSGTNSLYRASWRKPNGETWGCVFEALPVPVTAFTMTDATTRAIALQRVKRAFASQRAQWKSLAPVAELGELRRVVRTTLYLATDMVVALATAVRKRDPSTVLRYAQDIWLNFSFGVAPLLRDTMAAGEALASYLSNDSTCRARLAKGKSREAVSQPVYRLSIDSSAYVNYYATLREKLYYGFVSGQDINLLASEAYNTFGAAFGLRAGDILPAAWELIPYSWVVDYLANVGPWIEDFFFDDGGAWIYGTESRKYVGVYELRPAVVLSNGAVLLNQFGTVGRGKVVQFDRTVLTSFPRVPLRLKTSDELAANAWTKLANLAAVLKPGKRSPKV